MNTAIYAIRKNAITESPVNNELDCNKCQLVLGFGNKDLLADSSHFGMLKNKFPNAQIVTCSTAGEIFGTEVFDDSISVMAMEFMKTKISAVSVSINDFKDSFDAGVSLIKKFPVAGLRYVLVISDGSFVNGSELVRGIESVIKHKFPVTGGLAGDGTNFLSTLAGLNEPPKSAQIIAVGFYGEDFIVSYGSMGGWDEFGLERLVTKSTANRLYEIENKSAIELYKSYLGKHADALPGSALLFPLAVYIPGNEEPLVRTILSIDEKDNCMVFAGDVPVGSKVRFMKANFDRIIHAASTAAENSFNPHADRKPNAAILISCVGRKIILDKRVEEEVEAVAQALGNKVLISGFYSYGEITPTTKNGKCDLQNQTMTITTFDEK